MAYIFVLEDDQVMLSQVKDWLIHCGHIVMTASSFQQLPASFSEFNLIIVDWELPDGQGVDLCKRLRQEGNCMPVLMITGKANIDEKVIGYDSGLDDYLTKPFALKELELRVNSLLKRVCAVRKQTLEIAGLVIDLASHSVLSGDIRIDLNRMEFSIFALLATHPNHPFSIEAIISRLGGYDSRSTHAAIVTCVSRLKKKLPGADELITNVRGEGYMLRGAQ